MPFTISTRLVMAWEVETHFSAVVVWRPAREARRIFSIYPATKWLLGMVFFDLLVNLAHDFNLPRNQ